MSVLIPTEEQIAKLRSLPGDEPIGALNLFNFNERAQYQSEDPEYGTPEADITGMEAFGRYGEIAGKFITELGGRVVFSTPVDQVMIGPSELSWLRSCIFQLGQDLWRCCLIQSFKPPQDIGRQLWQTIQCCI
jgi:hypothetical protein